MKWAFAYKDNDGPDWVTTRKRFKTLQEVCNAAADWLEVCQDNGYSVAVKVVEVEG